MQTSNSWCLVNMKWNALRTLLLLLTLAASVSSSLAQTTNATPEIPPAVRFGTVLTFHSKILGEDRPYFINLPDSYNNKLFAPQKYPVLYVLDGEANFDWTCTTVRFMSAQLNAQIPEMIVVAIPNTGTNRFRDLTPTHSTKDWEGKEAVVISASGGGRKFEKFLAEELMPHIEGNYRTAPCRVFVGHSLGGLLAVDFFFQRPGLFHGCIAIDPSFWWDDQLPLREGREIFSKSKDLRGNIYVSGANNSARKSPGREAAEAGRNYYTHFTELLRTNATTGLRAKSDYYDSEDHGSVPFLSLYHGLLFIFDGFKLPLAEAAEDPMKLTPHFKMASARLGYEFLPPEFTVNWLGYQFLRNEKKPDKALQCFQLNVKNYPTSGNAWDSLADIWLQKGDIAQAIEHYERALKLSPNLKSAQNALKKLKKNDE